jgi:hypothetical protein
MSLQGTLEHENAIFRAKGVLLMERNLFGALYRLYIRYTIIGFEKRSNNNVKAKQLQH